MIFPIVENKMEEKNIVQKKFEEGYRFRITFSTDPTDGPMAKAKCKPIFVRKISEIGPLFRAEFPNDRNWIAEKIGPDGEVLSE